MRHSSRARRSPNKALIDRVPKTLDDLVREIVKIGEKATKLFGDEMIEISDNDIGDSKVPEIVSSNDKTPEGKRTNKSILYDI